MILPFGDLSPEIKDTWIVSAWLHSTCGFAIRWCLFLTIFSDTHFGKPDAIIVTLTQDRPRRTSANVYSLRHSCQSTESCFLNKCQINSPPLQSIGHGKLSNYFKLHFRTMKGVTRMAYSPSLWLMAIGWWNKINQCRKLKLNLTQTWGVCMRLDSGMHWSQYQWYCDDKLRKE